jgi:hypothetical protein
MRQLLFVSLLAAAAVSCIAAADAPYIGKWKLNASKSQLTGMTFSLEKLPSGETRFDMSGFAYNFRLDGKDYPTPDGGMIAWTAPAADRWEGTQKAKGNVIGKYKLTIKGDTAAFDFTTVTGGKEMTETSTWKRLSGGPGLLGKWQETKVTPANATLEILANGADGVTMTYPEYQSKCAGKFDEKPYPVTGAGTGGKSTMSFKKTGANSFEATTLIDGKPWYVEQISVSADGKTLTDSASPVAKKEVTKGVYDRQ